LTLLAPEIVEAILDGRQSAELQLDDLLNGFPLEWAGKRDVLVLNLELRDRLCGQVCVECTGNAHRSQLVVKRLAQPVLAH
jgi:hypothetical protein